MEAVCNGLDHPQQNGEIKKAGRTKKRCHSHLRLIVVIDIQDEQDSAVRRLDGIYMRGSVLDELVQ